jgi:molybdate transport system substrate-binding protein
VFGYSVTKSLKGVDHESNPGAGGISLFCRFRGAGAAILVALAVLGTMPAVSAAEIVVFTAESLKEALDDAVNISYAASSTLAKQIKSGAPADVFISADLDWMDYLQQHNLALSG